MVIAIVILSVVLFFTVASLIGLTFRVSRLEDRTPRIERAEHDPWSQLEALHYLTPEERRMMGTRMADD